MKDTKQLFSAIEKIIQPIMGKKGIHLIKLIEDWKILMPEEFKNNTTPSKIVWNKNNQGVLYIKSENYIINNIIMHKGNDIINQINSYFGYKCIIEIKFIT